MMYRRVFGLVSLTFFLLALRSPVFAKRAFSINADKTSLFGDEELTITASPSGFGESEPIYVKGAFYKEGTSKYFGYSKKGEQWIKNSTSTSEQRLVTIPGWDGHLHVKNDSNAKSFTENGNGNYLFKLGFYYVTSGGNISSVQWSDNSLAIQISVPSPTPTKIPTITPTNTPKPTKTPTSTTSPTPTRTLTPTKRQSGITPTTGSTKSSGLFSSRSSPDKVDTELPDILGTSITKEGTSSASGRDMKMIIISLLLVSVGLLILAVVFVWKVYLDKRRIS